MKLKLKSKFGVHIVEVDSECSLSQFLQQIESIDQLLGEKLNKVISLKTGFPPKEISLHDKERTLKSLGIKDSDQLIIEVGTDTAGGRNEEGTTVPLAIVSSGNNEIPSVYIPDLKSYLILRNIPDDNSCLFNAISYGMFGASSYLQGGLSPPSSLRAIVSKAISSDPQTYNEAVLGKLPSAYSEWISKRDSWGGAIELGILAEHFQIKICCLDIELGQIINFENYIGKIKKFIILVYLGIHYDILTLNRTLSIEQDVKNRDETNFPLDTEEEHLLVDAALKLGKLLQSHNYSTNTTTFRVRCLECYKILVGETGASKHANETGHFRFGEVK